MNKSLTKKIALCGIFAALAIVLLSFLGMTVLDLSLLVVCALMTMLLVVECGERMAWIYTAVTATLALLLLPSKLYAIEYTLFAGVYPLVKLHFEKLRTLFAMPLKISFLDCCLLGCVILAQKVFLLGDEYFALNLVTLLVGTVFFLLYDIALTKCISLYLVKLRKKLGLNRLFQ